MAIIPRPRLAGKLKQMDHQWSETTDGWNLN